MLNIGSRFVAVGLRRILVLPLLATLAATTPTTTAPSAPPLLRAAHELLGRVRESQYTHKTTIDERAGSYDCDCSGLLDYLVERTSPSLYHRVAHRKGKRPLAVHFYETFASAPTAGTQGAPGASPSWIRVRSLRDARAGDVLAWRRVELIAGKDTGHVVLLDSAPVPDGVNVFRVRIIDSTKSPHADDTRSSGQTGIGRGTLWFQTDEDGAPTGFRWRSNGDKFTALPIAIGRPANLLHSTAALAGHASSEE